MTDARLSWTGARWAVQPADADRIRRVQTATGLSAIAARCFTLRWHEEPDASFLTPSLDDLHDPALVHGMGAALERLKRAVRDGEKLRIITDYDVDGTTSSLILQAALRIVAPQCAIDYHIPNRFGEGYGFSVQAAEKAVEDGVSLIVTADIGVRDHASVAAARAGGVDVLICDHHLPAGESVPEDAIVLCPPQAACSYPNPYLAACGVSLKLAQALLADHPKFQPILRSLLKLAAIGTVADLVPLTTRENRSIVALGLAELREGRHHAGLAELLRVSGIKGAIDEVDLGYRVGPRINAAGRIEDARLVVRLLTERDPDEARALAEKIDGLNRERQSIQRTVYDEAIAQVDEASPPGFVVVHGQEAAGWHRGVVGIVASKVKERVHRPAAVVSVQGELAVGSVRSIDGVHAVRALDSVEDLLVRYGGHPAAAGFTVETANLPALAERLAAFVHEKVDAEALIRTRRVDAVAPVESLRWELHNELGRLGPFGMKNPRPRLLVQGVKPYGARSRASGKLLTLRLPNPGGPSIRAIWWGQGELEKAFDGRAVDLIGQLGENTWQGNTELQLEISDVRDAG